MDFVQSKYIYLISSSLRNFKKKGDNLFNFSCPFCGDSAKKSTKARGYIFEDNKTADTTFKCHNCGSVRSFDNFLYTVDPELWKQYKMDKFKESSNDRPQKKKEEQPTIIQNVINLEDYISKATDNEVAINYLKSRKIPEEKWDGIFFSNDLNVIKPIFKNKNYDKLKFGKEPRVILPVYSINNILVGIISRSLMKKPALRYINLRFDNGEPLVYNLNKVNLSERKLVFEGSFDSMFFDNAIAVDGADFNKVSHYLGEQDVLVFDNQPRNKELLQQIYKMANLGYNICVWPEFTPGKDVNEMILAGKTAKEIEHIILTHSFSGLRLRLKLAEWAKVNV